MNCFLRGVDANAPPARSLAVCISPTCEMGNLAHTPQGCWIHARGAPWHVGRVTKPASGGSRVADCCIEVPGMRDLWGHHAWEQEAQHESICSSPRSTQMAPGVGREMPWGRSQASSARLHRPEGSMFTAVVTLTKLPAFITGPSSAQHTQD